MQVALEPPPAWPGSVFAAWPGVVVTSGAVGEPAPGKPPFAWLPDSGVLKVGSACWAVVSFPESDPQPAMARAAIRSNRAMRRSRIRGSLIAGDSRLLRAYDRRVPESAETPRNPLRNEADMFRVLIMFGVGAAIVIAVALLIGSLAGLIVLVVLVAIGLWRTWQLIQDWRRYGSDPAER
jgi:hypothetical protein